MIDLLLRLPAATVLLVIGWGSTLFFGPQVGGCLGPLGVTAVECAKSGGAFPTEGAGVAIFGLLAACVVLILAPIPHGGLLGAIAGGVSAGAVAAVAYSLLRSRTMEGFDSKGTWLSIPRPLDPSPLIAVVAVSAAVGAVLGGRIVARALARPDTD